MPSSRDLFFQGHPGTTPTHWQESFFAPRPVICAVSASFIRPSPNGYFDSRVLSRSSRAAEGRPRPLEDYGPHRKFASTVAAPWRPWALQIYRAWLRRTSERAGLRSQAGHPLRRVTARPPRSVGDDLVRGSWSHRLGHCHVRPGASGGRRGRCHRSAPPDSEAGVSLLPAKAMSAGRSPALFGKMFEPSGAARSTSVLRSALVLAVHLALVGWLCG